MSNSRNFTARSVILSVLLGLTPPKLPVSMIVRTTELFNISEGTTRTALSRMLKNKELKVSGNDYELASVKHLQRQVRQLESLKPKYKIWDKNSWVLAVVTQSNRNPTERALLREDLKFHKFGELKEGVWLRPDNLEENYIKDHKHLSWFKSIPEDDHNKLCGKLFKIKAWNSTSLTLTEQIKGLTSFMEAGDTTRLKDSFIIMAKTLRHVQDDPLLPEEFLPKDWVGVELREIYFRFDKLFRNLMAAWFLTEDTAKPLI
jgi:phenylacetic acid degradation operon negative regulatory protein